MRCRGQLGFDGLETALFARGQVGSAGPEIREGFLKVSPWHAGQGFRVRGIGIGFQQIPQGLVHHQLGVEFGDPGEHCIIGCAEFRGIAHCIQISYFPPGLAQFSSAGLEGQERIGKRHPATIRLADLVDLLLRPLQSEGDVRDDVLRCESRPADVERGIEKGMHEGKP